MARIVVNGGVVTEIDGAWLQGLINDGQQDITLPAGMRVVCSSPLRLKGGVVLRGYGATLAFDWSLQSAGNYLRNDAQDGTESKIGLYGLRIEGTGNGEPYGTGSIPAAGIFLRRASDVAVRDVTLYRVPGQAMAIQGVQRARLVDNVVIESGRDGIAAYWYTDPLSHLTIRGNQIISAGDDCIAVHASSSGLPNTTARPSNIVIAGNEVGGYPSVHANGLGRGIICQGVEKLVVGSNVVDTTFSSGISINADPVAGSSAFRPRRFSVVGNTVVNAGQTGDGSQPQVGVRIINCDDGAVGPNAVINSAGAATVFSGNTGVTTATVT